MKLNNTLMIDKKITLLKPFFSLKDIANMCNVSVRALENRIEVMEIKADIKILKDKYFSVESKNKLVGIYEFEKTYSEILYKEKIQNRIKSPDRFLVLESKINTL